MKWYGQSHPKPTD